LNGDRHQPDADHSQMNVWWSSRRLSSIPMKLSDAIAGRRSVKRFSDRPVSRGEIETLLAAATLAPNHRLTQPWRFYVLGPEARHAYGLALGERKGKKLEDPAAAQRVRDTVAAEHRALPCMIAVAVVGSDNPETREEDYAAVMMAIENLALSAVELGLGTHLKTGGVMGDPAARSAAGVRDDERIVAIVNVGEPAEPVPPKKREPAASFTRWVP
jgi:nitroreductase